MSCKCAKFNEECGFICSVSGDSCMFIIPDSKSCADMFGEGPAVEPIEIPNIPEVIDGNYTDFSDY